VIRLYIFLFIILVPLHAFEDDDIDGVENSKDLCPDTSFEDTVDEEGCPENGGYYGKFMLTIGSDFNRDDSNTVDYNFFTNYNYHSWDFSLYSSQQGTVDKNNNEIQSSGDLYLSTAYGISQKNLYTKFTFGTKLATGSSEVSSGETDYFMNASLSYALENHWVIFSSLSYTDTGDSETENYNDPLGYSFGLGYLFNDKWYSSLRYQSSNSIYEDSDEYSSVSLFNSYNFNDDFFGTLSYTKGLDELSYDHVVSVRLGVTFE